MKGAILLAFLLLATLYQPPEHYIFYDGMLRTYTIHVPPSYNGTPIPLFIILHGGGGNAWHMEEKTGFSKKADELGFIALYPEGVSRINRHAFLTLLLSVLLPKHRHLTWNAGYCCGYAFKKNVDDVGYIEALLQKIRKEYSIDEHRIYIVGHSNGGMLAYFAASRLSEIDAAAVVAGTIGGYADKNSTLWVIPEPHHAVSIIHIHGMRDSHVPYYGGHGENSSGSRIDLSVNDTISFWIKADGCNEKPDTYFIYNGSIRVDRYTGGKNGTEVVLYSLIYGEHWWPGKNYYYFGFNATDVICDFLLNH